MKLFKQVVYRIKASLFLRNVATLASGTTLAQAVSIFTAPILYRIYDKEDYGTLGVYMAIVGVFGVFSTMQYNHAILLEKEDDDAKVVMWLNRLINFFVAFLTLLIVFIFGEDIGLLLGNEKVSTWLFLAPISIFFSGQSQIFSIWANRKKKYKVLTYNAVLTALLVPIVSIGIGLYNNGPFGLFMGLVVSQILPSIILLVILARSEDFGLNYLRTREFKTIAKKYKKFPIYSLPSELINRLTNQLPVFMLSAYAGSAVVGVYSLCVRMLGLPILLIGGAIGRVFQQKAAEDYNLIGSFREIYLKTFRSLAALSILPLLIILIFGPDIFAFVFGENWTEAGVFARILIIMYTFKFVASPLSYSYFIVGRLKENMLLHLFMLISMSTIFFIGFRISEDYNLILFTFSLDFSLIYLFYLYRSNLFSKKHNENS